MNKQHSITISYDDNKKQQYLIDHQIIHLANYENNNNFINFCMYPVTPIGISDDFEYWTEYENGFEYSFYSCGEKISDISQEICSCYDFTRKPLNINVGDIIYCNNVPILIQNISRFINKYDYFLGLSLENNSESCILFDGNIYKFAQNITNSIFSIHCCDVKKL